MVKPAASDTRHFAPERGRSRRGEIPLAVGQDEATWARARGWARWKALITLAADADPSGGPATAQHRVINNILTDSAT